GIYTEKDVLKMLMAGANVTMMLSSLLKFGIHHIADVLAKMKYWMEVNEYESVEQMRGSMSYIRSPDPSQFERANYMKALQSYKKSIAGYFRSPWRRFNLSVRGFFFNVQFTILTFNCLMARGF